MPNRNNSNKSPFIQFKINRTEIYTSKERVTIKHDRFEITDNISCSNSFLSNKWSATCISLLALPVIAALIIPNVLFYLMLPNICMLFANKHFKIKYFFLLQFKYLWQIKRILLSQKYMRITVEVWVHILIGQVIFPALKVYTYLYQQLIVALAQRHDIMPVSRGKSCILTLPAIVMFMCLVQMDSLSICTVIKVLM